MKFNTRELVTTAVFGTLWGIVEMSLGSVLKSLNVPMSGIILASFGLTVALVGRVFAPRRGSIIFMGVVAMLLKLFSLGGVVVGPMVGILAEALIAEVVLSIAQRPNRLAFMVAGSLGVLWAMLQPLITGPLLFGREIFIVWLDLIDRGSHLLGLNANAKFLVLAIYASIHIIAGCLSGLLAWEGGRQLQVRLGKTPAMIGDL